MNFKKSKDVKRSSYYVWFLGSKESKGLRGDEYVTPVLNYLLNDDCDAPLEPSKVTLQVSSKGLKIIQILTVPRKSCQKLNADQQSQLFANSRMIKSSHPFAESPHSSSAAVSSMLKSEQVKHHIPHNSITWVYQEEDIICAILLLYNPLTRCPVHVHAYRCDSVETADSLRLQLQALVNRPENQKKFRDIESRLRAKGLLLPYSPTSGYNYAEEELPPLPAVPASNTADASVVSETLLHCYGGSATANCPSKTLKSDGRSTRTEGSDELNGSEESNSSDLGYAICSKNVKHRHSQQQQQQQHHSTMMMIPPPVVPMLMHHHRDGSDGGGRPLSAKKKHHLPQHPLPPSAAHFKQPHTGAKQSKQSRQHKSKLLDEDAELSVGATAALYDSLAAELRAKLGNPKMGPLLLPPRDYDSSNNGKNKENISKQKMFPLTRSESSGKSSSGIGSEEALSNENQTKKSGYYGRGHYNDGDCQDQPQSFIDYDHDRQHCHQKNRVSNRYLFGGQPEPSQLYSLNAYSSEEEEEDDDDDDEVDFARSCNQLEVDTEDIEEDVLFTANCNRKSKSTFDLFPQQYKLAHSPENAPHNNNISNSNNFASNFAKASKYSRQQQQQQQQHLSYPSPLEKDHLQFAGERKSRSRHQQSHRLHQHHQQQQQQQQQQHMAKMYASNPNLSRKALKEVKQTSDKSAFVMGRREQRTLQQHQQHQHQHGQPTLISGSSSPVDKFSFGAMPTPSSTTAPANGKSHRPNGHQLQQPSKQPPKFYFADAEFGDSKMPLFSSSPLESFHFNAVSSGGDRSNANKSLQSESPRQHLGRSSGNLACLDYSANSGPTSLAAYSHKQQQHQQYSANQGSRSPGHFRLPRQETRYELPPPQMAPPTGVSSSASKLRTQYQKTGNSRGGGGGLGHLYADHPLGYDHDLAMRKKLEQPYSRYSYIDVDHNRAERFHYVPPVAGRR